MVKSVFQKRYQEVVVPKLKEQFSYTNVHKIPKIERIVINVGVGRNPDKHEQIAEALAQLSGQKPRIIRARKSIAGFKLREGTVNGLKITLRRGRMEDFFIRFIDAILPRTRDFRGIPHSSIDPAGNLSIGIKESIIFPELAEVNYMFGIEVTFITSAKTQEEGLALLDYMGVPFQK